MTKKEQTPDDIFSQAYQKDLAAEDFLDHFNAILKPHEEAAYVDVDIEQIYPTIYVVGVPRSGTTLVNQVLAHALDVGYVNQLIASTWQAPMLGAQLSQKLLPDGLQSQFTSEFGRTNDITEPHEFGYFWAEHLGYENLMQPTEAEIAAVDWPRLRKVIQNLSQATGKPFLFKPLMLTWYIDALIAHQPESRFIWIEREPLQTCLSILSMRKKMTGSEANWLSLKPLNYATLCERSPYQQVAHQIASIQAALESHYTKHHGSHMMRVTYEAFCENPQAAVDELLSMMPEVANKPQQIKACPDHLSVHNRAVSDLPQLKELKTAISEALARHATPAKTGTSPHE